MLSVTPQLIGIYYSPWTEKARWSLDHHAMPYRYEEHLLLFGMPGLRLRTGHLTGPLTVPAYCDGKLALTDSWEIARHSDLQSSREKLFPEESLAEIKKFNRNIDAYLNDMIAAAKAKTTSRPCPVAAETASIYRHASD